MAYGKSMGLLIRGYAERIASTVNDWATGMQDSGASDDVIRRRLKEEIEAGRILGEMRKFATAYVPGYVGEMVNRMGRDTLAQTKRSEEIIADLKRKESPRGRQASEEELAEIREALGAQGIDASVWPEGEPLPDVPPDADMDALFFWVSVQDKNRCEVCAANSEKGALTLSEWVDIGEPRSGACLGESRCRCVLVAADGISKADIPQSIEIPRTPREPSKV